MNSSNTTLLLTIILLIALSAWRRTRQTTSFQKQVDRSRPTTPTSIEEAKHDIPRQSKSNADEIEPRQISDRFNATIRAVWYSQEPHDTLAWRHTAALMLAAQHYTLNTNLAPHALFETPFPSMPFIQIYCSPADHPGGLWNQVMIGQQGDLNKSYELLGYCSILWREDQQDILALALQTQARCLRKTGLLADTESENRPDDIAWARTKIEWLWRQAIPDALLPPIILRWQADDPPDDFEDVWDALHG